MNYPALLPKQSHSSFASPRLQTVTVVKHYTNFGAGADADVERRYPAIVHIFTSYVCTIFPYITLECSVFYHKRMRISRLTPNYDVFILGLPARMKHALDTHIFLFFFFWKTVMKKRTNLC